MVKPGETHKLIQVMEHISSLQNPLVKHILRLQKKNQARKESGLFVAEGRREVSMALAGGIKVEKLLLCEALYRADPIYPVPMEDYQDGLLVSLSRAVYNRLAYRKDSEGILLLGHQRQSSLGALSLPSLPLVLVIEAAEKPGNLGAVFRTAEAAGIHAVILAEAATDPWGPNAIRASLGSVFKVPFVSCGSPEALAWLKRMGVLVFAAALQNAIDCYGADFNKPAALVFGAEDKGLSPTWLHGADHRIHIPMGGTMDSLNLSASVAILCFEALRQRRA